MTKRGIQLGLTMALAAALWIVPSVGTRGQGTFGDRFSHVDRAVVGDSAAARMALARADATLAKAVNDLPTGR